MVIYIIFDNVADDFFSLLQGQAVGKIVCAEIRLRHHDVICLGLDIQ